MTEFDIRHSDPSARRAINDAAAVADAVAGCSGIIHLAAVSRVAWGEADPALCRHVNVGGTKTLLAAALAQAAPPWFIFASSREVYGDPVGFPVREDAAIAPVNHYGRSKALGEQNVARARASGLRTATLRLSNVYGTVHDHPDRAVPALLARAIAGDPLTITGRDNFFDFVHVDDTVTGLLAAAGYLADDTADFPTIHLASGIPTTLGELARQAVDVAGTDSEIIDAPRRSFDVTGFCGDPAFARDVIGWTASRPLREGLESLRDAMIARGRPLDPLPMPAAAVSDEISMEKVG